MIYKSSSSARTKAFAQHVARATLRRHGARSATVVALNGELGSGKTTFVQGFAHALGAHGRVTSPTFIIVRRMAMRVNSEQWAVGSKKWKMKNREIGKKNEKHSFPVQYSSFINLYHIDAYRLKSVRELRNLELGGVFRDPSNIVLVEWPERIKKIMPKHAINITFRHGKNEHERIIELLGLSF